MVHTNAYLPFWPRITSNQELLVEEGEGRGGTRGGGGGRNTKQDTERRGEVNVKILDTKGDSFFSLGAEGKSY